MGLFPAFTTFVEGASAELVRWDDRIQVHFNRRRDPQLRQGCSAETPCANRHMAKFLAPTG